MVKGDLQDHPVPSGNQEMCLRDAPDVPPMSGSQERLDFAKLRDQDLLNFPTTTLLSVCCCCQVKKLRLRGTCRWYAVGQGLEPAFLIQGLCVCSFSSPLKDPGRSFPNGSPSPPPPAPLCPFPSCFPCSFTHTLLGVMCLGTRLLLRDPEDTFCSQVFMALGVGCSRPPPSVLSLLSDSPSPPLKEQLGGDVTPSRSRQWQQQPWCQLVR